MRKHIYVHTSNLENASVMSSDESFQPVYEYINEVKDISRNEWGRFKTDQNYYHIMLGSIRNDNCPWCGSVPNLVELTERVDWPGQSKIKFCLECLNCGSRGPVNTLTFNDLTNFEAKDHVKEMIKARYSERKQWDHELVNPYERHD